MQFKRRLKKDASIEISSLVDIVFLLLLFFVVTTTFKESPGLEIDLPETRDAEGFQLKDLVVNIVAESDGAHFFIGETEVPVAELKGRLQTELDSRPEDKKSVVVQADKNVRYEDVFKVFDIAREVGASGISLPAEFSSEQ